MFHGRSRVSGIVLLSFAAAFVSVPATAEMDRLGRAVQLNDQGHRARARELLETIVREEPNNHRALWNRGLVAMEDEQLDEAVGWFDRAIAIDDTRAEYHLWRGYAYAQKLRRSVWPKKPFIARRLRKSLERAVQLDPASIEAREALMRFYEQAPGFLGGGEVRAREQAAAIRRLQSGEAADR